MSPHTDPGALLKLAEDERAKLDRIFDDAYYAALNGKDPAPYKARRAGVDALVAALSPPVKTGGEAEASNGGTTYSPIGRNADGIEVYKRDARPVDEGALHAAAQAPLKLADKIHDACPHNMGYGDYEIGPIGCRLVGQELECVCEHVHMHAIRADRLGAMLSTPMLDEIAEIWRLVHDERISAEAIGIRIRNTWPALEASPVPSAQSSTAAPSVTQCPRAGCLETVGDTKDPGWDQGRCGECGKWFWRSSEVPSTHQNAEAK